MANQHHYFFAVKLPKEVKTFLNRWVQMHDAEYPFSRWVHPDDYHITLAFLGFAEDAMRERAVKQIGELFAHEKAFKLTLNELGTFGPAVFPRIFWADVTNSDELKSVQKKVYDVCVEVGFKLDKKPFKPHITLARKWKSEEPIDREKLSLLKSSDGKDLSFPVKKIVLYETHLEESPKYKEYASFPLLDQ